MFDLGFAELLVIGIVALIVVGPKDLPVMFRNVGRFVGRMRGMAREFSTAMNDAAEESGMRDIQKTLNAATNPMKAATDEVTKATSSLMDIDPDSETGKLAAERAATSKKIQAATARKQAERMAKEAEAAAAKAEALEAELSPAPAQTTGETPTKDAT